jgi:hypothetical protein
MAQHSSKVVLDEPGELTLHRVALGLGQIDVSGRGGQRHKMTLIASAIGIY